LTLIAFETLFNSTLIVFNIDEMLGKSSKSSMPEKMTLKLKGGGVVDPDSGLEDKAHVLKTKDTLYSVVLGIVDIQNDKNSYYKMQILEDDKGKK
jgi:poly [ADP-ribose] polymerase